MSTESTVPPKNGAQPEQAKNSGPMARKGASIGSALRRRGGQILRLTTFLTFLAVLGGFATYQRVAGQVGEQLVSLGDRLMDYQGATSRDETREVQFNGQSLRFSTGRTDDGFQAVLDHFEAVCNDHDGNLSERYEAAHPTGRDAGHSPVFRYDSERSGVVACLALGTGDVGVVELGERVRRYSETHDLHDLGDLRYVYAERDAADTRTRFVTFWTDGHFDVDAILPEDGDGGGTDIPDVARPPGSRRTISATETGTNDHVVQYMGSSMTEWELEAFYQRELVASGWRLATLPDSAPEQVGGVRVLVARRDNAELYVTLDTDARGRGQATIVLGQ